MPVQTFLPGPTPNTVRTHTGQILPVPPGWELLSPGDAALTRRVKAAGEHWLVQEKVGRKVFSRGVWAVQAGRAHRQRLSVGPGSRLLHTKRWRTRPSGMKRTCSLGPLP